jgi:hypothetical protein
LGEERWQEGPSVFTYLRWSQEWALGRGEEGRPPPASNSVSKSPPPAQGRPSGHFFGCWVLLRARARHPSRSPAALARIAGRAARAFVRARFFFSAMCRSRGKLIPGQVLLAQLELDAHRVARPLWMTEEDLSADRRSASRSAPPPRARRRRRRRAPPHRRSRRRRGPPTRTTAPPTLTLQHQQPTEHSIRIT